MGWIWAKEAANQKRIDMSYEAIAKAVKRHEKGGKPPPYEYRYVDGIGRGGKKLEIYIDEEGKDERNNGGEDIKSSGKLEQRNKNNKSASKEFASNEKVFKQLPKSECSDTKTDTSSKRDFYNAKGLAAKYLAATKEEQAEALRKAKLCEAYFKRERGVTFEAWAKSFDGLPSRGQFFRWMRLYKKARKSGAVLDAFIDERGRPKGSGKLTAEMKEMCERYIKRTDIHIGGNCAAIYTNMRTAFKDELPSYETVSRYINNWKKINNIAWSFRQNPDKAKSKHMMAGGNASEKAKYKNHYWELDSTVADVITADGKRWSVVGAIDVYSRRAVMTLEESGGAYSLCRNLRAGILKLGVPENVVTDNGKDYTSNHFEGVCINMNINQILVPPFSGDAKPHIERFFGTMSRELFAQIEGFCGHNVTQREGIRSTLSFEDRLKSIEKWKAKHYNAADFSKFFRKRKELAGLAIEVPMTSDELREWIGDWVEYIYEKREHRGIKKAPLDMYKEDLTPANSVTNKRLLDLLLGGFAEYTVGKKGISIRKDGQTYEYNADELAAYSDKRVKVMFPDELSEIYVYDENGFVCIAVDPSVKGESRERLASVKKKSKQLFKKISKLQNEATKLAKEHNDPTILDAIAIAKKEANIDIRPTAKIEAKTAITSADMPPPPKQTKKYFKNSHELLTYIIENGLENDEKYKNDIKEQLSLYTEMKKEFERKKKTA